MNDTMDENKDNLDMFENSQDPDVIENDQDDLCETRIRVPWMTLDEWKRVYEDVYSKNLKLQRRGYGKLLLWKARQSHLPTGVQCTMELMHVHITDQEVTQQISKGIKPMYTEHSMQLMCSNAIMRYLNHVSKVAQSHGDNLFEMANKVKIPKWVVNLRHETAHKTGLPSLDVLRMAVNFALQWLDENYWKMVSSLPELVISKTGHFAEKPVIKETMEVWQSINMYRLNGYKSLDEISDENLRSFIKQFVNENILKKKEKRVDMNNLAIITHRLNSRLINAISAKHSNLEKLVALILECELFVPSVHYLTAGSEEELSHGLISLWLRKFWAEFLVPFQEDFGLFPLLVHKLVLQINEQKCKHRQLVMALWIQQLCKSMLKSKIIMKRTYSSPKNMHEMDMSNTKKGNAFLKYRRVRLSSTVIKNIETRYPHLQNGFISCPNDPRGNTCSLADLKIALHNPNEFTKLFLPSLCDVTSPPVPRASKQLLIELASIWAETTDSSISKTEKVVYTVNDLYKKAKRKSFDKIENSNPHLDLASDYGWATCPLGILPWQRESRVVLDMPSHISWTLSADSDVKTTHTSHKKLHSAPKIKVNWMAVKKNLSVAKKLKKEKRMLKKIHHSVPFSRK